ncbi:protein kinase domain-containing protein [Trichonephila clavipes]|nr:protein kinase domain-containing protein [Trichonephila clavipes]
MSVNLSPASLFRYRNSSSGAIKGLLCMKADARSIHQGSKSSCSYSVESLRVEQQIGCYPLYLTVVQLYWGGCGSQCITMIVVVSLIVSGLVITAGVLTYRRWISHSKDDELPSITTPLNTSTFLVARGAVECPVHQSILQEAKMEFPRNQLKLEEVIGEGEFGKVMKGTAKNIANIPGTTTVAVKMLKDCPLSHRRGPIANIRAFSGIRPLPYGPAVSITTLSLECDAKLRGSVTNSGFDDEAHFWLNGYVNKQNCRIWSEANPQVYVETPLHPEKLTVWCALWPGGILLQNR